ncbi:MAG TPA: hypothetical protein VKE69_05195, partial [Planctomycetota bacterium]|nr:hypothetical protein [Planctomycetota bacterium]
MSTRARRAPSERNISAAGLIAAALLPGCVTCTWRDRALVERADLSTPALAFESFRAAIRCNDSMAGYRVISEEMKERFRFTMSQWVLGWDELFKTRPLARLMGNAEIETLADDGRRATAMASAYGQQLLIVLVRQDYYAVTPADGPVVDGYVPSLERELLRDGDKMLARAR